MNIVWVVEMMDNVTLAGVFSTKANAMVIVNKKNVFKDMNKFVKKRID